MWFLVTLAWIASVAGIFWAYGRKRRQSSSARAKELESLMVQVQMGARAVATTTSAPAVTATTAAVAPAAAPVAAVVNTSVRKSRVLGAADTLLYRLFRAGLPDHEIFANLTLADVVEPAPTLRGFERDQALRKLAQQRVNLVVCNKQLAVVAVVLLSESKPALPSRDDAYVKSSLLAAGVRIVRIEPAAMPRHHQIKALVYGDAAAGTAGGGAPH
jgi:hypothetical protein